MEERIIDDEFGRGVRLKKTKDGYVDVTDQATIDAEDDYEGDEVEFSFPVFDVDDEELVGLTPEEAMALQKRREEEAQARKEAYQALCLEGNTALEKEDFIGAQEIFSKAVAIDIADEPMEANLGLWCAKTENFKNPDVLAEAFAEEGFEEMEYALGYKTTDALREKYKSQFANAKKGWEDKEAELSVAVEKLNAERCEYLKPQIKTKTIGFILSVIPMLVLLITTIVLGFKNFSVRGNSFIVPTAICAGVFLVSVFICVFFANKFINVMRLYSAGKKLYSSDEGQELIQVRAYIGFYDALLKEDIAEE